MTRPDSASDLFEALRPRLLRLAYRMLGSIAEAEDVVQDAWLRWAKAADAVEQPAGYLSQIVTRLCLDHMRSARVRRETYVGAWLPDPLVGTTEDVEDQADELTFGLMLALERLSPLERAAFLLHDVFGMPFTDVADTLNRDAAAARQLAARARKHVQAQKPRYVVAKAEAERITSAFFAAARDGDVARLRTMLAEDAVLHSDGGGKVPAFLNPIHGMARILRLFAGLARKRGVEAELLGLVTIDGLPGYISLDRGRLLQTTALEIQDGRITAIYITRNPDKLRHVTLPPQGSTHAAHAEPIS